MAYRLGWVLYWTCLAVVGVWVFFCNVTFCEMGIDPRHHQHFQYPDNPPLRDRSSNSIRPLQGVRLVGTRGRGYLHISESDQKIC